jgi:hypothetical protein
MAKYQVLIVSEEFRVVEADSAEQAEQVALQMYCDGDIELCSVPHFICEEVDLIEEEE